MTNITDDILIPVLGKSNSFDAEKCLNDFDSKPSCDSYEASDDAHEPSLVEELEHYLDIDTDPKNSRKRKYCFNLEEEAILEACFQTDIKHDKRQKIENSLDSDETDTFDASHEFSLTEDDTILERCIEIFKESDANVNDFAKRIVTLLHHEHNLEEQRIILDGASQLVKQQRHFRSEDKPITVKIRYCSIDLQTAGKIKRAEISSIPTKAVCEGVNGIHIANHPFGIAHGVGAVLAVVEGNISCHSEDTTGTDVDTIVLNSQEAVLKNPLQCIPLIYFNPKISFKGNDKQRSDILKLHKMIQSAADDSLNDKSPSTN